MAFVFPPRRKLEEAQQNTHLWRRTMFRAIEVVIETIETILYPVTAPKKDEVYN